MSGNPGEMAMVYGNGTDEDRRYRRSRTSFLEYHYTIKHLEGFITEKDRVLETGCATGYYALHYANQCREYIGVDIHPPHIDLFQKKIDEHRFGHVSCRLGDATHLEEFTDNRFDVVLCLGPMYHVPAGERRLVFAESARVCRPGGILAFAYINRVGAYAGACLFRGSGGPYPNKRANDLVLRQSRDDERPDSFFYTMPEEFEHEAARHGLKKIKNLATDFFITMRFVDGMSDREYEWMKPLYDEMTRYESCTGMSNHALLICRKA